MHVFIIFKYLSPINPIIKVELFYFKLLIKFNFIHELSQFPKSIISKSIVLIM